MTNLNTTTAVPATVTATVTTPKRRIIALATAFLNLEVGDFDVILEADEGLDGYVPGLFQANRLIGRLQGAAHKGGEEYGWDAMWRIVFREFLDRARMCVEEIETKRS
jgi:hypothetical protein